MDPLLFFLLKRLLLLHIESTHSPPLVFCVGIGLDAFFFSHQREGRGGICAFGCRGSYIEVVDVFQSVSDFDGPFRCSRLVFRLFSGGGCGPIFVSADVSFVEEFLLTAHVVLLLNLKGCYASQEAGPPRSRFVGWSCRLRCTFFSSLPIEFFLCSGSLDLVGCPPYSLYFVELASLSIRS